MLRSINATASATSQHFRERSGKAFYLLAFMWLLTFLAFIYGYNENLANEVPARVVTINSPTTPALVLSHTPHQQMILDSGAYATISNMKSFFTLLRPTTMTITGIGGSVKVDAEGNFSFSVPGEYVSHGVSSTTSNYKNSTSLTTTGAYSHQARSTTYSAYMP